MKIFLLSIALLLTFALAGCETMEGLGKDIENLGESIQKKSKDSSE